MTDGNLYSPMDEFQRCVQARDAEAARTVLDDDYALVLAHPALGVVPRERWLEVLADYVVGAIVN